MKQPMPLVVLLQQEEQQYFSFSAFPLEIIEIIGDEHSGMI